MRYTSVINMIVSHVHSHQVACSNLPFTTLLCEHISENAIELLRSMYRNVSFQLNGWPRITNLRLSYTVKKATIKQGLKAQDKLVMALEKI